jgi:chitinase
MKGWPEGMKKTKRKIVFAVTLSLVLVLGMIGNFSYAAKPDRTAPTAPKNLKAVAVLENSVTLSWDPSTDNVGVTAYQIYKNNTYLNSAVSTNYSVTGLTPATTFQFTVKAKDARGNLSPVSNILTVTTATPAPSAQPSKKIVGYYAAWAAYSSFLPDRIDPSRLTHINYAFANIGSDLKITMGYPDIDPKNFTLLQALKQNNPNLKTLISIGGWTWSGKFSDAALTDASRTLFADSCVAFIKQYGFDGVDIDWEYPVGGGLSTNVKRPEDKHNFTLLLQKIREKLDAQGAVDNKHYLLTIAGGAGSSYANNVEMSAIPQYLDYALIMTYDLHGTWDTYTDLHAPLYDNSDASPQYKASVDSSINAWKTAGYPMDKLVMGIPFYGYLFSSVADVNHGLYQTYSGANSISYAKIASSYLNQTGYIRYFHSQSMVPWLYNGSTFITYEDAQSIGYKTDYIKAKGLGGAMIWELSQDPDHVLGNALYDGLK